MIDIKKAQEEAARELADEKAKDAKEKIKSKLREIGKAKKIVANLERELEDLYIEIGQSC